MILTFLSEALALKLIGTACIQNAITTPVQHLLGKGYNKAVQQIRNIGVNKSLPENHDILKALRIAMLRATAYMAHDLADEMEMVDGKKYSKDFKKKLKRWIDEEIKEVDERIAKGHFDTAAYDKVHTLLVEPGNEQVAVNREKLVAAATQQWIKEIQHGLAEDLPDLVTGYLINGWTDAQGNHLNWFDVSSVWFAEQLAGTPKALAKFQNRVLSEMATGMEQVTLKLDTALSEFKKSIGGFEYIISQWDVVQAQLNRIEQNTEDIKGGVVAVHDDVKEIKDYLLVRIAALEKERDELVKQNDPLLHDKIEELTRNLDVIQAERNSLEEKHKKLTEELERSLSAEKEKDEKKKLALAAIEEKDYDKAEEWIKESTKDAITEAAEGFYQLGNVKELKLEYRPALEYYELAAKASPGKVDYLRKAGSLSRTLGYLDKAISYLQQAVDIEVKNGETSDLATLYNEIGAALYSKGEYDKAIEYYEKALLIDKQHYGESHPDIAALYNNLGESFSQKGAYDKAIEYFEKALVIDKEYYGESHPDIAIDYNNLGGAWDSKGEYDKAIGYYEKALEMGKEYYGESHPDIAIRYNNLGLAWDSKEAYDKAIEYYEKALVIDKQYYGESHPDIAIDYNNLGGAWDSKGEYDKAIGYYEQALVIDKQYYGESHPNIAIRYNNLGGTWYSKGEYGKAIEYFEKALVIDKQYYGESHPKIAIRYNNLGMAWNSKGACDKAVEYYEKALTIDRQHYGETHPQIAIRYNNLGMAWYLKGAYDKAIELFSKTIDILLRFFGEDHPYIQTTKQNLAACMAEKEQQGK